MSYAWKSYAVPIKISLPDLLNCDGIQHPTGSLPYRRYRRGKYRCQTCGARDSLVPIIEEKLQQMKQALIDAF